MSAVKHISTNSSNGSNTESKYNLEEEVKKANYDLLVSFCKGEIGNSITLPNNESITNPNIYLPRYIFSHILSYKGMDWLYHCKYPKLMRGYRRRNNLIRSFCEKARLNHLSRVNFENIPIGTFCTFEMIMDNWYNHTWDANQKKEFKRLMGKAYANATHGYKNEWLYAKDITTNNIIKTSDFGDEKINKRNEIINYSINNNNRDKLPLPLKIYFKARTQTGAWPRDINNNLDLTADILWPENRADIQNFFKKVPSIYDIEYYGW